MKKEITVVAAGVLEARPLAELVGIANKYASNIMIGADNRMVNAKSIMGVIGLGIDVGTKLIVEAKGTDEEVAIAEIEEFLTK